MYLVHGLGGGALRFAHGSDENGAPEPDFRRPASPAMVDESFELWNRERKEAEEMVAGTRHNGHADLIRQAIDGTTGE